MITQEKQNKINQAISYMKVATELVRRSFSIPAPKKIITKEQLSSLVRERLSIVPMLFDYKYHLISFSDWEAILNNWWENNNVNNKYTYDVRDCDNFAFNFASTCSKMFGLNSAGVVGGGNLYWHDKSKPNGVAEGRHAFTCIVALNENNEPDLYLFEPMHNVFTRVTGQSTIINNNPMTADGWTKYEPDSLLFF